MIPVITFETVWDFVVHMFTTWLPWAQNWMLSLSTLDWQNYTDIMHDQWIVDVYGTGWQWIVAWQFTEAVGATFGASLGLFMWWFVAHLLWPWASFIFMGLFVPFCAIVGYALYIATIYFLGPVVFVQITNDLLRFRWGAKFMYLALWLLYSYLLFYQTPSVILISPGWYLLITILYAIGLKDVNLITKTPA